MSKPGVPWIPPDSDPSTPRRIFLNTVRYRAPEVLSHLRDVVAPQYALIPPEVKEETSRGWRLKRVANPMGWLYDGEQPQVVTEPLPELLSWRNLERLEEKYAGTAQTQHLLVNWAQRFRLNGEWVFDAALQTLYRWERDSQSRERLQWFFVPRPSVTAPLNVGAPVSFTDPGWVPHIEAWSDYQAHLLNSLTDQLAAYRATVEDLLKQRGWRQRQEVRQNQHYTWLALYQIKCWSPAKIADHLHLDQGENTVLKGIEKAAAAIGLTLRAPLKGQGPRPMRKIHRKPRANT
jgi:hypothetical protein